MRKRRFGFLAVALLVFTACQSADDGAGSPGGGDGDGATGECIGEGDVILSGWQASPEEGELLEEMFAGFEEACPNITIDYQPVAGDYPQAMLANFSAGTPPDVFYVDSAVAPEWIQEQFLLPLDDYIADTGFDTGQFYEGYLDAFRGSDGQIYGLP